MTTFKIDTHVHTAETSFCGKVKAAEVVRLYKDAGYDGIVITDHYYPDYFHFLIGTWEQKIDRFLQGYRAARSEGERVGLTVILGAEFRFAESWNDYLIYGVTEEFLYANPKLYKLGLARFREVAAHYNILIVQAHPFRFDQGITPADPDLLDGVEIFNGNPRHDSNNELAVEFAKKNSLPGTSGSDFHQREDLARGGIVVEDSLNDSMALAYYLRSKGPVELITSKPPF